jgi:hypothetical protein
LGFATGIATARPINGQVFDGVTLRGQREWGIHDSGQALSIRNLKSENSVPALHSEGGFIALFDSELKGQGRASSVPAVRVKGEILVRRLKTTGYLRALEAGAGAPVSATIEEFISAPRRQLFSGGQSPFPLPVEELPEVPWDPPEQWANVRDFGAIPADDKDDTAAIQAAIDSGKSTVYLSNLPNEQGARGGYQLDGPVFLRGKVRRFIGTESSLGGPGNGKPGGPLHVVDGEAPVVVIERIGTAFPGADIEMKTERTLVLKNLQIAGYRGEGGKLFIEDVSSGPWHVWHIKNQKVWAWQFNPEVWPDDSRRLGPHLVNDGSSLWVFGFKTEQAARTTIIETKNGGRTEILGGHLYTYIDSKGNNRAMFEARDSALSVFAREALIARERYNSYVKEAKGGQTRELGPDALPEGAFGGRVISYEGGL